MNTERTRLVLALAACALLAGCSSPRWDGEVKSWGTVKEVLRDGNKEGKVELVEASTSLNTVGIGTLEGLTGEVIVFEGQIYTSRAFDGEAHFAQGATPGEEAAFLVVAEVEEWTQRQISAPLRLSDLEKVVDNLLEAETPPDVFPFVIEGVAIKIEAHVLNGRCPYADDDEGEAPVMLSAENVSVRLVGFYSNLGPGELTHHDSKIHVHAIVLGEKTFLGHVDDVLIQAGAKILLPKEE